MDKQTLSGYGWIVIVTLVLSVMLALGTPFGTYVGDGIVAIVRGYVSTSGQAISNSNISDMENKWNNKFADDELNHHIIHNDGKYYTVDNKLYTDHFPENIKNGDVYLFGDYSYTYETASEGWMVRINTKITDKNQTSYGTILESINGEPITSLRDTFYNCTNLITAPEIPDTVTDMYSAFSMCSSLTTAPAIPNGVTNMYSTFNGCSSLTVGPSIPPNVENMQYAFSKCSSMTTFPSPIPSSVTNMYGTFFRCSSLTGTITIYANPTAWHYCFYDTVKPIHLTGFTSTFAALKFRSVECTNNLNLTIWLPD